MGKFARKASSSSSTLFSLVHATATGISNEQKIMDGCLLWPLGAVTLVCYIATRALEGTAQTGINHDLSLSIKITLKMSQFFKQSIIFIDRLND